MSNKTNPTIPLNVLVLFVAIVCATARAKTIYVDADATGANNGSSWDNAYNYLQDALADADSSTKPVEIWVAQGTYKPDQGGGQTPGDRTAMFQLINGVAIKGGYVGVGATEPNEWNVELYETILSGNIGMPGDNSDNSYHVVSAIETNDTVLLEGFTITGAQGGQAGGGMFNRDSSPTVTHCVFTGNTVNDYGGGMYNEGSIPILNNCTFSNNGASYGGAVFNLDSNSVFLNCDFTDNSSTESGGGMYNTRGSLLMESCVFQGNRANKYGGAVYNWDNSPVLTDCTFDDNDTVEWHGGGVYNSNSSPVFKRCNFLNNHTWPYSNNAAHGGGMYNNNSTTVLKACIFEGNVTTDLRDAPFIAREGGAIYNFESHVVLYNCDFEENFANWKGGTISNGDGSSVTATNCKFSKNMTDSVFVCGGGAISGGDIVLTNCEFVRNSSYLGGAIYSYGTSLKLTNCTLVANTAGLGDAIYDSYSNPVLVNCILWGNSDYSWIDETDLFYTEGSTPVVNYSCIQGWTGSLGGVGNIGDNPMFVREPDSGGDGWGDNAITININEGANDDYGTLHLLPSSPCIDAGDNTAVPPDTNDLDSDGDTTEPIPWDLDGDTRFTDEPNVPDTGNGTPPIVDIGAYESPKQGFLLSTELLTIPEGGTSIFTVSLRLDPLESFVAFVANISDNNNITVKSGTLLMFNSSNYTVPQTVTLQAAEDDDNFDMPAEVAVIATSIVTGRINVIEKDNEPNANTIFVDADAPGPNDGSSWENAYTDLQDALDKAVSVGRLINHIRFTDSEIWIAEGTYKPTLAFSGDRTASFILMRHLVIKGGYAGFGEPEPDARDVKLHETILSGDLDGDDNGDLYDPSRNENSFHVVTGRYTDETTLLEGFTITAGNANLLHGYYGGGGLNNYKGHLTVDNCKFIGNSATSAFDGGGGAVHNRLSNPTITNCSFNGNRATGSGSEVGGGAIYNHESTPTISGCVFTGNVASEGGSVHNNTSNAMISNCTFESNVVYDHGGAIQNYSSAPTIMNSTFIENNADQGGGIYGGNGTVINCIFSNNSAMIGGGMVNKGSVMNCTFMGNSAISGELTLNTGRGGAIFNIVGSSEIVNCLFVGNYAAAYDQYNRGEGGALYNLSGDPVLVNCTVVANTATHSGGGIYGNQIRASNCIFWANSVARDYLLKSQIDVSDRNVDYCCIQGWDVRLVGMGNINDNPLFVREPNDGGDGWGDDPKTPDVNEGANDDYGNLHLLLDSPCIDAGDNSEPNLGATDLDGHPRIIDGDCNDTNVVDMGAYEFNYTYIGDFDYNCSVDFFDFSIFALTWFTEPADEQWNPFCNIGIPADSYIDWRDVAILCGNWLAGVEP